MFSFIKHISTMSPCKKVLFHRYLSTTFEQHSLKRTLECLNHRSILRVSGNEVTEFLQGLVTNDMRHLEEGALSMYTMFLNTKGRVLYDAIIYRTNSQNAYYIESDSAAVNSLQKHLKLYCVRRKIDIENVESELKVWALYNAYIADEFINNCDNSSQLNNLTEQILSQIDCTIKELSRRDIIACKDPRLTLLGTRLLYAANKSETDIITELGGEVQLPKDEAQYKILRYKLGVGEGVIEIPAGNCFPLEANCDYLHGVSFHKGCYIGQELTARTHHTGVVRKRLMPLIFDLVPKNGLEHDAPILAARGVPKKPIGKLRGVERNVGIGLLRVSEALDSGTFQIYDGTGHTMKPFWWPQEAPKERVSLVKH